MKMLVTYFSTALGLTFLHVLGQHQQSHVRELGGG